MTTTFEELTDRDLQQIVGGNATNGAGGVLSGIFDETLLCNDTGQMTPDNVGGAITVSVAQLNGFLSASALGK